MNQVTIDEILSYLDGKLTESRRLQLEQLLLDDDASGKMFLAVNELRQRLGDTRAVKEYLKKEKQVMLNRLIED